jgi:hypothetical protein
MRNRFSEENMDAQKKTHDQRAKEFWDFARHVSEEVEEWPAWKRDALVTFSASNTIKVERKAKSGQIVSVRESRQKKNTSMGKTAKRKK